MTMIDIEELAGPHEQWCQNHAHCCGPSDCDCGRNERRDDIAKALAEAYGRGRDDEADGKPEPEVPEHDHTWIDEFIGTGDRRHLRDQLCTVCRERRTVAS